MSFTPTTEQVREGYADDPTAEYYDPLTNHTALNRRAFDRWLVQHNAIIAQAERERIVKEIDASPAVLWAGKGGAKERILEL